MVVVEPVADPVGQRLPVGLVGEDAGAAEGVEPLDAVGLDFLLALEAELLLDLDFDREAVRVPPGDAGDRPPLHDAEPADQVLDGAGEDVVDAGPAVGGRRSLEEDERAPALPFLLDPLKEILGLPAGEQVALELVRTRIGKRRESHLGAPGRHGRHACFFSTSSVWACATTCAYACSPSTSPSWRSSRARKLARKAAN